MTDRVVLSDDNFTTRDASNNITFSSDRYYVKNDPTGNFFLGGLTSTAVLAGVANLTPRLNTSGRVISRAYQFQYKNQSSFSLNSGSLAIPIGTTRFGTNSESPTTIYGFGGGIILVGGDQLLLKNNGNPIQYNYYINNRLIGSNPAIVFDFTVFQTYDGMPLGSFPVFSSFHNFYSQELSEGGVFSWSPSHSTFNSYQILSGSNAGGNYSVTAGSFLHNSSITARHYPLSVSGEQRNVSLEVTA